MARASESFAHNADTRLQRDNRSAGGGGTAVTTIQREIMKRKQKKNKK